MGAESSLRSSGSQEIPQILGNVKVHWCHHKSPTLIPVTCTRWICHKSVTNIPSTARSSKWSLFQEFHTKTMNVCSVLWMLQTQPICPWFGHHDKWQRVQEVFMMQFSSASSYFLTLRFNYPPEEPFLRHPPSIFSFSVILCVFEKIMTVLACIHMCFFIFWAKSIKSCPLLNSMMKSVSAS